MRPTTRILLIALGTGVASCAGVAASEDDRVHLCEDEKGNVVLQQGPCAAPAPDAAVPKPAPIAVASRPESKPPPVVLQLKTRWIVVPPAPQKRSGLPRRIGKQTFPTSLHGQAPPAEPSFATPERTWQAFLAAIERGDRTGDVACFTPAAIKRLGVDAGSFPLEDYREMLSGFTSIENSGDAGPFWSIHGIGVSQRPKWIFFEETDAGEWKISGI